MDVDVDVDMELDTLPTDDDFADFDLDHSEVEGDIVMAQRNIGYDPGHSINMGDVLTGNTFAAEAFAQSTSDVVSTQTSGGAGAVGAMATATTNCAATGDATAMSGLSGATSNSAPGGSGGAATGGAMTGGAGSNGDVMGGAGDAATNGDGGVGGNAGTWSFSNGDGGYVTRESNVSAAASNSISAFNMYIVMGANVLGNTADMNVVGGSFRSTCAGETTTAKTDDLPRLDPVRPGDTFEPVCFRRPAVGTVSRR